LLLFIKLLLLSLRISDVLFYLAGSFRYRENEVENQLVQQVKQNDIKDESHNGQ
jgi:hypothetical protein